MLQRCKSWSKHYSNLVKLTTKDRGTYIFPSMNVSLENLCDEIQESLENLMHKLMCDSSYDAKMQKLVRTLQQSRKALVQRPPKRLFPPKLHYLEEEDIRISLVRIARSNIRPTSSKLVTRNFYRICRFLKCLPDISLP